MIGTYNDIVQKKKRIELDINIWVKVSHHYSIKGVMTINEQMIKMLQSDKMNDQIVPLNGWVAKKWKGLTYTSTTTLSAQVEICHYNFLLIFVALYFWTEKLSLYFNFIWIFFIYFFVGLNFVIKVWLFLCNF